MKGKMQLMQTIREVAPDIAESLPTVAAEDGMDLATLLQSALTDYLVYRQMCKDSNCW